MNCVINSKVKGLLTEPIVKGVLDLGTFSATLVSVVLIIYTTSKHKKLESSSK